MANLRQPCDIRGPDVVLVRPLIPPNTGNAGRLCAILRARLHLVHPLGFRITDADLRRSGLDYWRELDVRHHEDWAAFLASPVRPARLWLVETGAPRAHWDAAYAPGDGLVFGNETDGSPPEVLAAIPEERRVTIPHADPALRSLNLSTAVGVAAYEAYRQFVGAATRAGGGEGG